MAHITLGNLTLVDYAACVRKIPTWLDVGLTSQQILNVDVSGTLSGQLTTATVATPWTTVIVRYRSNDFLIARIQTDENGNWSLPYLELGQAKYFAYAYTDSAYNVARLDKLVPV